MREESYSKPLAPLDDQTGSLKAPAEMDSGSAAADNQPLTNADFRRLLQVPSSSSKSQRQERLIGGGDSTHSFTHKLSGSSGRNPDSGGRMAGRRLAPQTSIDGSEPSTRKSGASAKNREKTEEDELNEILKKYRDRAKERREGEIQETQQEIDLIQASGYRVVAPDLKANLDLAEKRKKLIEESKYLGGDMEHTHLVKGLDYALLQKVRSEIVSKEREEDDMEKAYQAQKNERDEVQSQLKSPLSRSIYQILFKPDPLPKTVNELFATRRMAYVIDLDEEAAINDSEIPTTLIRSKQDCPIDETSANLSINDMVIQKLTQVLSYLRADNKKKRKGKIPEQERLKLVGQGIYDEVGDYVPSLNKTSAPSYAQKTETDKQSSGQPRKYFDKPTSLENSADNQKSKVQDHSKLSSTVDSKLAAGRYNVKQEKSAALPKSIGSSLMDQGKNIKSKVRPQPEIDSYAECYPGGMECYDAAGDSDDDADFSKMDLGNKKGPIRRWDFETEQEYEEYMSMREAMPKAAFQYGVKMLDGRKTRKLPGGMKIERDDKAKLDRQWAKISQILAKRKESDDFSGNVEAAKRIKY